MKNYTFFLLIILAYFQVFSQFTAVPDPNFEQYLLDENIDTDGLINGQFLTANAIGIEILTVDNYPIEDLTGIEAFQELTTLYARNNNLTALDLSQNSSLVQLVINDSANLLQLDVTQNTALQALGVNGTSISSIDVSQNINLNDLKLSNNGLSSIDLSNLNVYILNIADNNITTLDVSQQTNLGSLTISDNLFTNIDLTNLPALQWLNCRNNNLTDLDLSQNTILKEILCFNNELNSLDLTNNTQLEKLSASSNQLSDISFANSYPNFDELYLQDNAFTEIELTGMPALEWFFIARNQLTSLDITELPSLSQFICSENNISTPMDFTSNPLIESISIDLNPIPAIDLSNCSALTVIDATNTAMTNLDISNNPLFENLFASDSQLLEVIDARNGNNAIINSSTHNSPNLSCIIVDDTTSGDGDWSRDPHTTLVNTMEECNALGVDEFTLDKSITLYPNPVANNLNIDAHIDITIQQISIYDLLGNIVFQPKIQNDILDVSSLVTGMYLVHIVTDQGTLIKKIVKE
jgi:Leucine-rich repeat (LRR) protein